MIHALLLAALLFYTQQPEIIVLTEDWTALRNIQKLPDRKQYLRYNAWNLLCFELRDIDCTGIKVPKVLTFDPVPSRPGLLGYYKGGDTIYVRSNLSRIQLTEVLTHEGSHYFDVEKKLTRVPGRALEICWSEKRAWKVSDNYNKAYGNPKDVVGKRWVQWYKHCTPYKDVLYPPKTRLLM